MFALTAVSTINTLYLWGHTANGKWRQSVP